MEEKLLNIFKSGRNISNKFILQMARGDTVEFENDIPPKHNAKNPSVSPEEEVEIQVILE